jgi:TRAP-type C4-dicarboxylate transport system substrate-binding protein
MRCQAAGKFVFRAAKAMTVVRIGKLMFKALARCVVLSFALLPALAGAEPVKLKLAFFTSDRSVVYQAAVKPFVDAVNAEGKGWLQIEIYFSGILGKGQAKQPELVVDGVADIAFVVPGQEPERFHDDGVIELPYLFRDVREASLTYSRLIAANALQGYEDFFVIGAFASEPNGIHSRKRLASLADLKGQRIRTNNLVEAAVIESLGGVPAVIAMNKTFDAISSGNADGATSPPSVLFEFGVGRVATHHYMLPLTVAPMALLMNKKKFDSLPEPAKNLIRKYSGEWTAARWIETFEGLEKQLLEQIKADPRRTVTFPSQADVEAAEQASKSMVGRWLATSERNRQLLAQVEAELVRIRASR